MLTGSSGVFDGWSGSVETIWAVLAAFIGGTAAVVALTPVAGVVADWVGAVDAPDHRRVHRRPIPRLGGLAIIAAVAVGAAAGLAILPSASMAPGENPLRLVAAVALIAAVGFADDVFGLGAGIKFVFQFAAAFLAVSGGLNVGAVSVPFVGTVDFPFAGPAVTALWIVGVTNAINLIDGLDGLAAGLCGIASVGLLAVSWDSPDRVHTLLLAAMAGACLGFLRHNFHPARIFMGDTGSLTLGFLLACLSIPVSQKRSTATVLAVPIVLLAVPLVDTAACFLRRIASGRSPFHGDLGHVHHLLLSLGWNQRQVALTLYVVSAGFAVAAGLLGNFRDEVFLAAVLTATALIAAAFYHRYRLFSPTLLLHGRRVRRVLDRLETRLVEAASADPARAIDQLRRAGRVLNLTHLSVFRAPPPGAGGAGADSAMGPASAAAPLPEPIPLLMMGRPAGEDRQRTLALAGDRLHVVLGDSTVDRPSQLYVRQLMLQPLLLRLAESLFGGRPAHPPGHPASAAGPADVGPVALRVAHATQGAQTEPGSGGLPSPVPAIRSDSDISLPIPMTSPLSMVSPKPRTGSGRHAAVPSRN